MLRRKEGREGGREGGRGVKERERVWESVRECERDREREKRNRQANIDKMTNNDTTEKIHRDKNENTKEVNVYEILDCKLVFTRVFMN